MTDDAGAYVNRYSYLPFGETSIHAAGIDNPYTFVGEFGVRDDGDGLFDMRFRSYDAAIGRFLSVDPLGIDAGDVNFRRYVHNDPSNGIDPLGLSQAAIEHAMMVCDAFGAFSKECLGAVAMAVLQCGTPGMFQPPGGNSDIATPGNPGGPNSGGPGGGTRTVGSMDPNDITGPAGVGPQKHVRVEPSMPYTIRFENVESATAPAQEVFVTHGLDTDLNLATFELGDFGFADVVIDVPDGVQSYATTVSYQNLDGSPVNVEVLAELDAEAGVVYWTFRSVDPDTGLLPDGVFDGFLPPNDETRRGDGFVSYVIRPRSDLTTGTTVDQQASIVFDVNDPILTNVFTNTIDAGAPTSSVDALPAETENETFTVSWSGADDAGGSGIAFYDVFVSTDGGAFEPLLLGTTETSSEFTGQFGSTFGFYSVATDLVGLAQPTPGAAQATTTLTQSGGSDVRFVTGELIVDGTNGPDKIHFYKKLGTDKFYVRVNDVNHGPFVDAQKMIAFGGDGGDRVTVMYAPGMPPTELHGEGGNDRLYGGWNDDVLIGGDGRDLALGAYGRDRLEGGAGNDVLRGQSHDDLIFGGAGRDILDGGRGNDILRGGQGGDLLRGSFGDDILLGEEGQDRLYGNRGRNLLLGGLARDRLQAGNGGDLMISGPTAHDNNDDALMAILAEWSSNRSLDDRAANVTAGVGGPGGNDYAFTLNGTVENDNQWSYLIGGADEDWFFKYRKDILINLDVDEDHVTQ